MTHCLRTLVALTAANLCWLPVAHAAPAALDEPAPILRLPQPRLRWQPTVSLAFLSAVGTHGLAFGSDSGATPTFGGELRVMWQRPGSVIGLGFRLAGSSSLRTQATYHSLLDSDGPSYGDVRVLGFDAGFVFSASWFWLSSGVGVMHVQDLRAPTCGVMSCSDSSVTMPDLGLALGLDIPLGRHVALRLFGAASTLLVSVRASAGGGLVVRF